MPETLASIFADPQDLRRYREAIANGASENEALRVGDNGKGAWGDDTTSFDDPIVAIHGAPYNARVLVTGPNGSVIARNADKAPNNGRIDLNPAAAIAIGHTGGLMPVKWSFLGGGAAPPPKVDITSDAPVDLSLPGSIPDIAEEAPPSEEFPALDPATLIAQNAVDPRQTPAIDPTQGPDVMSTDNPPGTTVVEPPPEAASGAQKMAGYKLGDVGYKTGTNPDGSIQTSLGYRWYPDGRYEKDAPDGGKIIWAHKGDDGWHWPPPKPPAAPKTITDQYKRTWDISDPNNPKEIKFPEPEGDKSGATPENPYVGFNETEKSNLIALLDKRYPVTSRMLSNPNPALKKLLDRAYLIDPDFAPYNYDQQRDTVLDYGTKGKSGQLLASLNTFVNHVGELEEASHALKGTFAQDWNGVVQGVAPRFGKKPEVRAYHVAAAAVEEEFARMLKQGVATLSEIQIWRDQLAPSQDPSLRETAIKEIMAIAAGKVDTALFAYKRVMGKPLKEPISPKAVDILKGHGWDLGIAGDKEEDGATPTPTPSPTPGEKKPIDDVQKVYDTSVKLIKYGDARQRAQGEAMQAVLKAKGVTLPGEQ